MISEKISSFIYYLMMLVLITNVTQRKHIKHGERKRLATLWTAGSLLFFQVELVVIQHYKLSDGFIIPAVIVFAFILFMLRSKILVFRTKCKSCGAKLGYKRILYWDNNLCETCDPPEPVQQEPEQESPAAPVSREDFRNLKSVNEVDWDAWEPEETAVICYIFKDGKVLLINKKTGLGKGKVNAPGGRIKRGEMPVDAAIRETEEETGLTPLEPEHVGTLSFIFTNGYSFKGFVFFAHDYKGSLTETDEADPFWQDSNSIPYDKMWEDDAYWLPAAMNGNFIEGKFIFDEDKMVDRFIETKPAK